MRSDDHPTFDYAATARGGHSISSSDSKMPAKEAARVAASSDSKMPAKEAGSVAASSDSKMPAKGPASVPAGRGYAYKQWNE